MMKDTDGYGLLTIISFLLPFFPLFSFFDPLEKKINVFNVSCYATTVFLL